MVIFGYEEQVGEFFVPNGTSPDLVKKMKTKERPEDIYANGCFQEDTELVCSVYQCDSYPNLLWLKGISFVDKLVSDIDDDKFYFYLVVPFGTSNGFIGISGENATKTQTQINWPFTNSISKKVISDVQNGKCKIIIDQWSEGHPYDSDWITTLHKLLDSVNIPRTSVYYLTSNQIFKDDYDLEFDDKLQINILTTDYSSVELFECFRDYFDCENDFNKKRTKHFMSFNRAEKPHRSKLVNFLESENLLDKGYVSYKPKKLYLDTDFNRYSDNPISVSSNRALEAVNDSKWFMSGNEIYLDSYINVTTETYFVEPDLRFSEKTFKPIVYQQPFILYSTPFSLKHLRSVGYKTFNPFIDESYDKIEDNTDRLIALNNEVKRLCNLPIEEIHEWYVDIKEILIHNFNHFKNTLDRIPNIS